MKPKVTAALAATATAAIITGVFLIPPNKTPQPTPPPEPPSPKILASPPRVYYFTATAIDTLGQESEFSNEVPFTNRAPLARLVTLAWDHSPSTNPLANYRLLWGTNSRAYFSNTLFAGTATTGTVRILPPILSNLVITVSTSGGSVTSLASSASWRGPWTNLNCTNWAATNPGGTRYFRGLARKAGGRILISSGLQ